MAEREGFEPSVEVPLHSISSAAPSAARTPLRKIEKSQTLYGGGGGIRTHGPSRDTAFRVLHLKPLGHPSWKWTGFTATLCEVLGRSFAADPRIVPGTRLALPPSGGSGDDRCRWSSSLSPRLLLDLPLHKPDA